MSIDVRDEFEAWWIAHGYSLTQNKSSLVDFAEIVWLAAVKQSRENELKIPLDVPADCANL